ncbi:calcium channel protein [Pseudomonas cavernae]|uniref:Calcium channel protein n=1 Tax=Pseudomonas cavernae TaxID=2320867 RepID=A0A385Z4A5_9PSED|nr:cache domain-containing protein [Pseudomonas cavernae]AYC32342.1 calcium channel protein [Pseudomonas cavernae]
MRIPYLLGSVLTLLLAFSQPSRAAAPDSADTAQAKHLLQSAVEYYRVQGDAAFAAFSRQGEFIDGEHYVFVVDTRGTMLASGGTSAVLIGRDVSAVLEPELRTAFAQALASDEGQVQTAEYRWMNARDSRVERKQVYYQRVGERIIAVGHYLPRAAPEQAQNLLNRAVAAFSKDPQGTLHSINQLSADFREDDLYVFVVDLDNRRYVAHGYNLRLLGVDFATIQDPEGKPVGAPILALMSTAASGGYDYHWKNPVTAKVEGKHALLRKVGHYLLAVGYYRETK